MGTTTKNQLENIDISTIKIGKNNPRKTFDEQSLNELSESIKSKGVLQPILVRPGKSQFDGYELVCGERRLKAAILAGLEAIPANIRELTDDEAFDMQITENLERKDVHPLEEAEAFKKLLDSGKYEIADIAAKFAKTETFIAQRLKFVDLIDEIKEDFYKGELGIGHAVELARLDADTQKEFHDKAHDKFDSGYGTVKQLRNEISDGLYYLEEAAFDTESKTLLPKAGACSSCPKRSGANPTLFPDVEETDACFDGSCFRKKLNKHLEIEVSKIVNEGKNVHLLKDYRDVPDFIQEMAKQFKIPILRDYEDFRTWGNGRTPEKGLYVSGRDAGKVVEVYLTQKSQSKAVSAEEDSIEIQIQKIEARAKRALELDDEKVWAKIREMDQSKLSDNGFKILSNAEKLALFYAISSASYMVGGDKEIEEWRNQNPKDQIIPDEVPDRILNRAIRIFICDRLNGAYSSHKKIEGHAALKRALEEYYPDEIKAFEKEQQEIAEKRISRTNERLEKLRYKSSKE